VQDDDIVLGREDPSNDDDEPDLGPDERDADLMDGTWEQRYYAEPAARRDWQSIYVGIALLILMAMLIPLILAAFR
jgi:hypothetical protein